MGVLEVAVYVAIILFCGIIDRLRGDKINIVNRTVEKILYGGTIGFLALGFSWGAIAVIPFWLAGCSLSWSFMGTYLRDGRQSWESLEWWQGNSGKIKSKFGIDVVQYNAVAAYFMLVPVWHSVVIRGIIWGACMLPLLWFPLVGDAAWGLAIASAVSFYLSLKVTRDYIGEKGEKLLSYLDLGDTYETKSNHKWANTETVRGLMNGVGALLTRLI